jgi:hypothetical protein
MKTVYINDICEFGDLDELLKLQKQKCILKCDLYAIANASKMDMFIY